MNKRKIEINQLKRIACKGKKVKTITVKYETVLAYFKQKDSKDMNVFQITFMPLISDLLNQLTATEFVEKIENESKQPIKNLQINGNCIKLESFQLKGLSKQFPIQEICGCLVLQGGEKGSLSISKPKLMSFFKHLRGIYSDFCYCAGEKLIVESTQLKILYELFTTIWSKNEEKGKLSPLERLQRKVCRTLYFLGVIIENNIFSAIEGAEHKLREEESDCGTRSEHKKNIKGVNQQVSTAHTFSSLDPSSLSVRLKSQTSQQENFPSSRNNYSEKSEKIISRSRYDLWDKAELKQLKFKLTAVQADVPELQPHKFEINYLSNDVENILIEQAFKIERLFTTNPMEKQGQYAMIDFASPAYSHGVYQQQQYAYMNMNSYYPYYGQITYPQAYIPSYDMQSDASELSQLKRSLGCLNLVETRKKDIDRYH